MLALPGGSEQDETIHPAAVQVLVDPGDVLRVSVNDQQTENSCADPMFLGIIVYIYSIY